MDAEGVWHQRLRLSSPGPYRVYADFKADNTVRTLSTPISVPGHYHPGPGPRAVDEATLAGGYRVVREAEPGKQVFRVVKDGRPAVGLQPYLGARGHLVAVRRADLAYLHTHPHGDGGGNSIPFLVDFPSRGTFGLFLQFRHDGKVHTAAFTVGGRPGGGGTHTHHESG
jgi:hypothetical protein